MAEKFLKKQNPKIKINTLSKRKKRKFSLFKKVQNTVREKNIAF